MRHSNGCSCRSLTGGPPRSSIHRMMNKAEDPAAPAPGPAVHAAGLTVLRGGRTVLDGLDFTAPRGEITGLLGPSGCGKSTLMRAVVGTQAHVTGTLDVLGRPAGHRDLRPRIGY